MSDLERMKADALIFAQRRKDGLLAYTISEDQGVFAIRATISTREDMDMLITRLKDIRNDNRNFSAEQSSDVTVGNIDNHKETASPINQTHEAIQHGFFHEPNT